MVETKKTYNWEKHYPKHLKWNEYIDIAPVSSILEATAEKYPNKDFIDFFDKKYSFEQINQLANKMAKGLQKIGVIRGQKIGLLLPNCPYYLVAYFAILKIGAVVVNFNPQYTIKELVGQVQDSQTSIMITLNLAILCDKTTKLLRSTCLEKIIICRFQDILSFPKDLLFQFLRKKDIADISYNKININFTEIVNNDGNFTKIDIDPKEDIAVLQYTGGTTGTPKAAMLTHANIYSNLMQCSNWFSYIEDGQEKVSAILPFFHSFSMMAVMLISVRKALEMVVYPKLDIKKLISDIEDKKINILAAVPTLYAAIINYPGAKNRDFSSLNLCISGGAPLPFEIKEKFESIFKARLVEGYGLSEASPVVAVNDAANYCHKSVGFPLQNTIIEIRDPWDNHKLLPIGQIGEVCVKGPQVMKGYLGHIDDGEDALQDGRLHTGDMGYVDEYGHIFIVDRLKEMIITAGFNVYPREVEEEIYKHDSVEEVAVVGINHKIKGQVVKAFVKLKANNKLEKTELIEFLSDKIAKYKLPKEVEFISEMPKTLIGKISKKELLKKHQS